MSLGLPSQLPIQIRLSMLRKNCWQIATTSQCVTRCPQDSRGICGSTRRRDYSEALEKLYQLPSNMSRKALFESSKATTVQSQDVGLAETLMLLRRAGYTQQDLAKMKHIHVAGTKGKGSVCAYATAMLSKYRTVGTYTSPHLVSPRERVAINGVPVGQELFAEAFFELWDRLTETAVREESMTAEEAEGPESKTFFFGFMTLLAWHIFLRQGITDVVMECGIGGEYDLTNILPAEAVSASVVTQLGIDHVAMLGDTVEKISWHKAGIFKPGVRGFTMTLKDQPSVMEVLRTRAAEKGAELVELDGDLVEEWGGVSGGRLMGDFQKKNQALAVAAVREHLGMHNPKGPLAALENIPDQMLQGLREASIRGRCEVLTENDARDGRVPINWLLDGAHTKESLDEVAKWCLKSLSDETDEDMILLFNQQERNAAELLSGFLESIRRESKRSNIFRHAIFTRNELERPVKGEGRDLDVQNRAAERFSELVFGDGDAQTGTSVYDNLSDSVAEARRLSQIRGCNGSRQKILVTGSLYLVGGVLRILEPQSPL